MSSPTSASSSLPKTLPQSLLENARKLSASQAGHLRHFHNLSTTLPGEWPHMGTQLPGQEWLDSLRYQLSAMAYATGAAHYHRLPALLSVFKKLLEALIGKMMHKEVWSYWYLTSQSGRALDPDIQELRKPWSDPVVRENIMACLPLGPFSGHLLLMVSLHAMLFDDNKYDAPDALVFEWNPIFWGMGPEKFTYSRSTLQVAILKEMERENWMGVCCEPNNVFVVCNQFPIIAVRYNDIRNGTNVVNGVLEKYTRAWKSKKGFHQGDGLFVERHMVKQDDMVPAGSIGFTAWVCAFMNSWNSEEVHALYPSQALGFLSKLPEDGRVNLNGPAVGRAIRALVAQEGADPDAPATIEKARATAGPPRKGGIALAEFGYVAQWVSEVGDEATLDGLLRHADMFLHPTWEHGGLFYPRTDEAHDAAGNWTLMDPFSGNGAIGYARLNVRDGQRTMWAAPWDREHFAHSPYVDGVDLASGVDFLRGAWDAERWSSPCVRGTGRASRECFVLITPVFRNLPLGTYGVYINGELSEIRSLTSTVKVSLVVGGEELDVVLLKETV
ncbi:hypothetical protein B0H17DRAFT_940077 [Mycena rosella]|uniref:Linalool dehydratase/isomerase domain-containing protein n=1 Tax=Mycena rosella TaxID=1033263 RepID=A0AAD7DA87_MYCRO|nr:hypothetical protein B0H17DRAFT_940077 [Mycena rosella]